MSVDIRARVGASLCVRHEDRRSDREIRLKLAVRELRTLQERIPEHRVEPDRPDREIKVLAQLMKNGSASLSRLNERLVEMQNG